MRHKTTLKLLENFDIRLEATNMCKWVVKTKWKKIETLD
jgi:hypothetical protein